MREKHISPVPTVGNEHAEATRNVKAVSHLKPSRLHSSKRKQPPASVSLCAQGSHYWVLHCVRRSFGACSHEYKCMQCGKIMTKPL